MLVTVAELGTAFVAMGGPLLLLFVMPGPELGMVVVVTGGLLFVIPRPLLFVTAHRSSFSTHYSMNMLGFAKHADTAMGLVERLK